MHAERDVGSRRREAGRTPNQEVDAVFRTIAEVFSSVGHAVGTVVSAPFRLVARLFGGG